MGRALERGLLREKVRLQVQTLEWALERWKEREHVQVRALERGLERAQVRRHAKIREYSGSFRRRAGFYVFIPYTECHVEILWQTCLFRP